MNLNYIARLYKTLYITSFEPSYYLTAKWSRISTLTWKITVFHKFLWKGELEVSLISREPRVCTHLTPPDPPVCVLYYPHPSCPHQHPKWYTAFILLCIIHLFCSYCYYHICSIMFHGGVFYYDLLFDCFYYFLLSLCVLFIINLFFTHVLQTTTQHSSDCCNLPLLSTALEAMSTEVHQLLPLYHLFRSNLALYWLLILTLHSEQQNTLGLWSQPPKSDLPVKMFFVVFIGYSDFSLEM